jgi:hypothetical protein
VAGIYMIAPYPACLIFIFQEQDLQFLLMGVSGTVAAAVGQYPKLDEVFGSKKSVVIVQDINVLGVV